MEALNAAGKLGELQGRRRPEEHRHRRRRQDNIAGSIVSLIESRGDVVGVFGANGFVTPAIGDAVAQLKHRQQGLLLRLRPRAEAAGADPAPARSTGSLGQQPFLQGFWPVMQLYLQIDRGIAAANLDTRAQLVTKDNVDKVGKRFEN